LKKSNQLKQEIMKLAEEYYKAKIDEDKLMSMSKR